MKTSTPMRMIAALIAAMTVILGLGPATVAHAEGAAAKTYDFRGKLNEDGVLEVEATLKFDEAPAEVEQTIALEQAIDDRSSYTYTVDNVSATVGESEADVSVDESGDAVTITVDTSEAGDQEVTLKYNVTGTTDSRSGSNGDLTVFEWRVLQGLSVGVDRVTGQLLVPSMPRMIDCEAGPPGTVTKCDLYTAGSQQNPQPMFQSDGRAAGDEIALTIAVDGESVPATADITESWSLDRAFTVSPLTAGIALGAFILGSLLLYGLFRRIGVDQDYDGEGTLVASFRPVAEGTSIFEVRDNVRPGEVGTVADERVDPVDVTATLLDLAVRGHLRITELDHGQHELLDWKLERTPNDHGELVAYEQKFLDAIAPEGGSTLVSKLPETLAPALPEIQSSLYDEVVNRGWFEQRPDSTRNSWRVKGFLALGLAAVAAVLLVIFTKLGLLALVLLVLAAILLWIADRMPRRTAAGSKLVTGLQALSALLTTQPTDRMPKGREIEEISKLIPYAVVLGGKQRWLQAMVDADDCDQTPDPYTIDWYHAPETWHLQDLPTSLTQFVHTVQGELFAR